MPEPHLIIPAEFGEGRRDGLRPGLDGPDGVLAVARPRRASPQRQPALQLAFPGLAAAALLLLLLLDLPGLLGRGDRLGLEHDGALGLVHQAQLAQPVRHGVRARRQPDRGTERVEKGRMRIVCCVLLFNSKDLSGRWLRQIPQSCYGVR